MTQASKRAEASIPAGFVEVTKEVFFARLKDDPRDIMPSHSEPMLTRWTSKSLDVFGVSRGWADHDGPEFWAVRSLTKDGE